MSMSSNVEIATFGGGCFWCTEALFIRVDGVISVESGYAGGDVKNPSYEEICEGETGHAEVIQVKFNHDLVSFAELLEMFFKTHDPTTLNSQGVDMGTQYRSVIFYHTDKQQDITNKVIDKLTKAHVWDRPIVTEITAYNTFYSAEKYHRRYYENNKLQMYCQMVITPKVKKFEQVFKEKLKK